MDRPTKTGAGPTVHATLARVDLPALEDSLNIIALADRANAISDPTARGEARLKVLDLASSISPRGGGKGKTRVDKRPSYKRQGKWGHGFVPLDQAARESKAKGSPVAMKRMNRIFKTGVRTQGAGTGRAGQRSAGGRKDDTGRVKLAERGGGETVASLGQSRTSKFADAQHSGRVKNPVLKEASKQTRIPKRAVQNWDEIPAHLKTIRNGKRYVVAIFGGKRVITEWVGGVNEVKPTPLSKRKVMRTIREEDANAMTTGELRNMVKNKRNAKQVRKAVRKALTTKEKKVAGRG